MGETSEHEVIKETNIMGGEKQKQVKLYKLIEEYNIFCVAFCFVGLIRMFLVTR